MLSHAELRAIWMQAWRAFAWIDGEPVEIVGGLPSRTYSSRRVRGTCSFGVPELPQPGKFAQVDLVLNGLETARFFTGKTAEQTAQLASFTRTANLVDRLDLDRAVATELTWSSTPFVDAVRALLNQADIADEEIASIYDPGATYVLGADYPIVIATTENIGRVFGELMEFGGTAAYVSPTGRIKVVEASGIPAATSPVIYAYGADADTEFGITDSGLRIGSSESVVNTFTATGPKRPDGAAPDGTYQSGLTGRPASQSYRFAQSDETCQAIAARELSRRARDIREYWFEAPLNPLLLPGDSILYRDPTVGLNANTPAYIWEVSTTADAKMRVQISIGPSLVDGYSSSVAPPDADFAMTVEHQPVTLEGVPVVLYLVQVADQSRDPSGEIVSRAWTATGPGATPASASDVERAIFTFTSLDGAEISLTVTSSTDEAATVTRSPASNQIQILSRVVSVAADEGWFVLTGPAGWNSFTSGGACTAVPPYNEQGPLIAGFSDGDIYRSADNLMTAPTTLATLDGSVGCLWVNETNISHILAGHGSKLSRSLNGGATWTLVSTFPATVNYCQSSPNNTNELRVCAGDREYISWDGGVTWPASVVGAAGSTAQDVGQAPWGHAVAFSGSIAAADAVKFEEGYAVDWTGVAAESLPASGLQAITPLLDEQGFLATAGYSLVRDGSLASLVLSADSGGESIYKLLLNPVTTAFDATLLTPATAVGPGKLINQTTAYPIGASSATQVGLGRLGAPRSPCEALILTWGATPGGVMHAIYGGWTLKNTGLPTGWYWRQIQVNPLNADDWLIIGDNGSITNNGTNYVSGGQHILWRTQDAGATWAAVPIAYWAVSWNPDPPWANLTAIGYTTDNKLFATLGTFGELWGLWRGDSSGLSFVDGQTTGGPGRGVGVETAIAGIDGDIILVHSNAFASGGPQLKYYRSGETSAAYSVALTFGASQRRLVRSGLTRRIVRGYWRVYADYRTATEQTEASVGGDGDIAGGYLYTCNGADVLKVDISTSPPVSLGTVATAATNVQCLVSDKQTQTLIAGILATSGDIFWSGDGGATWTAFPGPLAASGPYNTETLATVVREL